MEITCFSLLGPNTSGLSLPWSHSSRQLAVESERRTGHLRAAPPSSSGASGRRPMFLLAPGWTGQAGVGGGLLCSSSPSQAASGNEVEVSRIVCLTPGQGRGLLFTGLPHASLRISECGRIRSLLALHSSGGHCSGEKLKGNSNLPLN